MPGQEKPVFISYARSTSQAHAVALQGALGAADCFLDLDDIPPDSEFPRRLSDALLGARVVVVIASSLYFHRSYCLREWQLAQAPWDAPLLQAEAAPDEGRLAHVVVVLDGLDANDVFRFPPPIRRRSLLPVSSVNEVAALVRQRLDNTTLTLDQRLERYRVSRDSVDLLLGRHVLPVPPESVQGVPAWPLTLRPSLGDRFVGRADEFWRLHDALWGHRDGEAAAASSVALYGGGGFGKSQLALEYLHRMGPRLYRGGLLWVDASEGTAPLQDQFRGILKQYPEILRKLEVNPEDLDRLAEPAMRDHLAQVLHHGDLSQPVLFVVDNVPEPSSDRPARDLREYCPGLGKVTCVVTSRVKPAQMTGIAVDVVSRDAAVTLLGSGLAPDLLSPDEWRELAEWSGMWPIGLEHLNGFLRVDPQSARSLLESARTTEVSEELEEITAALKEEMPVEAVRGVSDLFALSLSALSAPARELLFRAAWLAPAPIPRGFLEALTDHQSPIGTIRPLVARSWMMPSGPDMLLLHRVVASYLRAAQPDPSIRVQAVLDVSRRRWTAANDAPMPETTRQMVVLAPHAAAIATAGARFGSAFQSIVGLLNAMGDVGSQVVDSAPLIFAASAAAGILEAGQGRLRDDEMAALKVAVGNLLFGRGYREQDARLQREAVAAYRGALELRTRSRYPVEWAKTQNRLGNALSGLGDLEQDPQPLRDAVTAYRAAMEVRTRDGSPAAWAMTQNNLGNALEALGELEHDPQQLRDAVAAFRAALEVRTRDGSPIEWATTQNNLGNALRTLGELEHDPQPLSDAVSAYRAALEVPTRDTRPLYWAKFQGNLGYALQTLGGIQNDAECLRQSVAAYRSALEVYTRDLPLLWAGIQNALGMTLAKLWEHESGPQRLEEAITAFQAALEVYSKDRSPREWEITTQNLEVAVRSRKPGSPAGRRVRPSGSAPKTSARTLRTGGTG